MNLFYLAHIRFPTEKAHGKQVREMCNALIDYVPVTLLIPSRRVNDTVEHFGLDARVRCVRIATPDLINWGRPGFLFMAAWFSLGAMGYVLLRRNSAQVITREYSCALACSLWGIPTAWESHRGEWNWVVRLALHFHTRLIVISNGLKEAYKAHGVTSPILVAPDGVDLSRYKNLPSKEEARQALGLPKDKIIVIYNGHLILWKGVEVLARSAALLPERFLIMFMGGTDADIDAFRKLYGHDAKIAIIGRKSDTERPLYLRAADITALPNTGEDDLSARYTSPLKLFGYMASGTPIVSSDLPSMREILSEKNAYLVKADDPQALASAFLAIADNPQEATERARWAQKDAAQYEWHVRAQSIIDFISRKS